ncbi:MAG: hypothetical protein Greene041679_533, partial [Parcubacteria group bacterium Greene0416_79]
CLEEKLGEEFFSTFGKRRPSAGEERTMRECFEEARRGRDSRKNFNGNIKRNMSKRSSGK